MSSSLTLKSSNTTRRTFINATLASARKCLAPNNDVENGDLIMETFINSLQLQIFFQLSEQEQNERLSKIDVLELFHAVQNISRELAMVRLENHILVDFLEKNDPKLLIGLEQRRATVQLPHINILKASGKHSVVSTTGGGSIIGFRSRSTTSKSILSTYTTGSQKKAATFEYKLNFRAKADMAEKMANKVERKVHEIEKNVSHEIKLLRAHMEEIHFMQVETQETAKNFELHFLCNQNDLAFLNTATEKQLERKFRKFANNWIKNARALLATMHLKITAIQEYCQKLRNELLTKTDLSGILTAIDFEKLIIKRSELLSALEEKNTHMAGLKGVTARASLSMAQEKQIMTNIEIESKQLNTKTLEIVKAIAKLEKDANIVEAENHKDIETLKDLRIQLKNFEAPSVNEYVEKKDEFFALEKEEKMLRRKINILNMKLSNTQKKYKQKMDSTIIINMIEK